MTPVAELDAVLARFTPREIIVARTATVLPRTTALDGVLLVERDAWEFDESMARGDIARHFAVRGLDGLGLETDDGPAVAAAGALLRYLKEMQPAGVPQLGRPVVERAGAFMPPPN